MASVFCFLLSAQTFGVLSDPEAIHDLLDKLGSRLRVAVEGRIDMLYTFTPDNPTGRYSLALSHPTHHMVARRLLALSTQQEVGVRTLLTFLSQGSRGSQV